MAVTERSTGWVGPSLRATAETDAGYAASDVRRPAADAYDPLADEPRWPAWKVTVAVIGFCGAFWTGIYLLGAAIFRLLG